MSLDPNNLNKQQVHAIEHWGGCDAGGYESHDRQCDIGYQPATGLHSAPLSKFPFIVTFRKPGSNGTFVTRKQSAYKTFAEADQAARKYVFPNGV